MKSNSLTSEDIDAYILQFPPATQKLLQQLRETINKAAPNSEEIISYQMPAFKKNKILVYFGGYKNHIGFYPTSSAMAKFKELLSDYKTSKGAVQFPLNKPLPLKLITEMVKFRQKEDEEKSRIQKEIRK